MDAQYYSDKQHLIRKDGRVLDRDQHLFWFGLVRFGFVSQRSQQSSGHMVDVISAD